MSHIPRNQPSHACGWISVCTHRVESGSTSRKPEHRPAETPTRSWGHFSDTQFAHKMADPPSTPAAGPSTNRSEPSNRSAAPTNRSLGIVTDAHAAELLDDLGLVVTAEMLKAKGEELDEDQKEEDSDDSYDDDDLFAPTAAARLQAAMSDATVGDDGDGDDEVPTPAATSAPPAASTEDHPAAVHSHRGPRPQSDMTSIGMGFNRAFGPPGAYEYLMEKYQREAWRPEYKDVDTQTVWEAPPPPPPPKLKSVYEQIGESVFVRKYQEVDADEEFGPIERVTQPPIIDPERPNVAIEFGRWLMTELVMVIQPLTRLPCSRRIRRWFLSKYHQIRDASDPYMQTGSCAWRPRPFRLPALYLWQLTPAAHTTHPVTPHLHDITAYAWMAENGGVLRYVCLATAAGGGICSAADLMFVEGAKGLWDMHFMDILLIIYLYAVRLFNPQAVPSTRNSDHTATSADARVAVHVTLQALCASGHRIVRAAPLSRWLMGFAVGARTRRQVGPLPHPSHRPRLLLHLRWHPHCSQVLRVVILPGMRVARAHARPWACAWPRAYARPRACVQDLYVCVVRAKAFAAIGPRLAGHFFPRDARFPLWLLPARCRCRHARLGAFGGGAHDDVARQAQFRARREGEARERY